MISFQPGIQAMRKMLRLPQRDILSVASDQWLLAEGTPVEVRPARYLPGQIERIRGAEFGSVAEVVRDLKGGFASVQNPTMAYQIRDAVLIDGVLYAGGAVRHLKARSGGLQLRFRPHPAPQATLYESWAGNRWFGNWLMEDCLTYRLAEFVGWPVATQQTSGHATAYEEKLGMAPTRLSSIWFDELILFDDRAHNENKRWRAADMRLRLIGQERARHPGVFLLRGASGAKRVLRNEREIAARLAERRGFTVIDPVHASVEEIVDACAGADVIAGVEGSHLVHGLVAMPQDARAFVIQPPDRAVSVLKLLTDRQGQSYSFVIGVGNHESFTASVEEVERTLDLV